MRTMVFRASILLMGLTCVVVGCGEGSKADPPAETKKKKKSGKKKKGNAKKAERADDDAQPKPKPAAQPPPCQSEMANSELPCPLSDGRMGWCSGGTCKDICPAGYSYDPLDTQCHQRRDCQPATGDVLEPVKTAKCNRCMGEHCFDEDATQSMPE